MNNIIKLEEIALFILCIVLFHLIPIPNKWFWICLLLPDIGMLGYLFGARVGAIVYNVFHHKGVAVLISLWGYFIQNDVLIATGIILLAHSSMDRVFGYGLKYFTGFEYTHLGKIGKHKKQS